MTNLNEETDVWRYQLNNRYLEVLSPDMEEFERVGGAQLATQYGPQDFRDAVDTAINFASGWNRWDGRRWERFDPAQADV